MKLTNIYIISWFGNDDVSEMRRKFHTKQLEWAKSKNLQPVVLAQDYKATDYVDGVTYIDADISNGILLPSAARNILLQEFYKTDDDFAIFADNDAVLYNENQLSESINFIELMRNMSVESMDGVDIISFTNPAVVPFKKELSKEIYRDNFVFSRIYYTTGPIHALKNLKKHHGVELFYDADAFNDNGKIITCEEHDFCINAMYHGAASYLVANVLMHEYGRSTSTWVDSDANRDTVRAKHIINKKYNTDLYMFPDEIVKTYGFIGHGLESDGITRKIQFSKTSDITKIQKSGLSDVKLYPLPNTMTAQEAIDFISTNEFYDMQDVYQTHYVEKNRTVFKKSTTKNPIRFNWSKPEFKHVRQRVVIPKTGVTNVSKVKQFFSF